MGVVSLGVYFGLEFFLRGGVSNFSFLFFFFFFLSFLSFFRNFLLHATQEIPTTS